jgi:hypothetical protein
MVARARRWTRGVLVRLAGVEADDAGMSTAEYATVRLCTLKSMPVYQARRRFRRSERCNCPDSQALSHLE